MGIDGTQIDTPHTLKTTAVSLLQTKKQQIAWLLGLVGVTIAAGTLAAGGISKATADITDATINSSAETISTSASALTNLNSINETAGSSAGDTNPLAEGSEDVSSDADVNVSVSVNGPAQVRVNGDEVDVPDHGTSRQTIDTGNGNVNISVTNRTSSESDSDSQKTKSDSTFRIKSSTSTKESTSSVSR